MTFVWLLYLNRRLDFFGDEWDFVTHANDWTLGDYFVAHNEHWSTLPMISYKVVLAIFGMGSYLPFSAVLLLVHTASAFVLFLIVRRHAGDLVGIAAAGLLLVVAHGSENVLWAFQVGFVGSVLFGLLAIYLLQGPVAGRLRPGLASAALVASLASSGVGIFFLPTVALDLWLDRARRRLWWVLTAPVVAYGIWFLAFGRDKATVHRSPLEDRDLIGELASYVPSGMGSGLSGMLSIDPAQFGRLALAAGSAGFALLVYRSRPLPALAIGAAAGLVAQYAVTGLVRAQFGPEQAMSSRYIYIATVFGLLIFCAAPGWLPSDGAWRLGFVAVVAALLVHDVVLMNQAAANHEAGRSPQSVRLQTAWLLRDAPDFDPNGTPDPANAPTMHAGDYVRARAAFGSPYQEISLADLSSQPAWPVNDAMNAVLPLDLAVVNPPRSDENCKTLDPAAPSVQTEVGDRSRIWFVSTSTFPVSLQLRQWLVGEASDAAVVAQNVDPGQTIMITAPDSGLDLTRRLQVSAPPGTLGAVCHSPTP